MFAFPTSLCYNTNMTVQVEEKLFCPICNKELIPIDNGYYYCPEGGGSHRKYWKADGDIEPLPIELNTTNIIGNKSFIDACKWALKRVKDPERRRVIQNKLEIAESQDYYDKRQPR